MNYKVFLVEDEIVTREGIRDNVDWEAAGFEFCGEAPDGEMALPLIEETKPDVLITDIKMPFMDGLQLSKIVHEQMPWVKIVILSGHNEFEYAQSALKLGVTDYLLKPVSSKDLYRVLETLSGTLEQEKQEREELKKLERSIEDNLVYRREKFLIQLLMGGISSAEAIEQSRQVGLDILARYYLVIFIRIELCDEVQLFDYHEYQRVEKLVSKFAGNNLDVLLTKKDLEELVLLIKSDNLEQLVEEGKFLAYLIKDEVEQQTDCKIVVGLGSPQDRLGDIHHSFAEALVRSRPDQTAGMRFQTDLERFNLVKIDREAIENYIKTGVKQGFDEFFSSVIQPIGEVALNSHPIKHYLFVDIILTVSQFISDLGGDADKLASNVHRIENSLVDIRNMKDLKEEVRQIFATALNFRHSQVSHERAIILHQAKAYIDEEMSNHDLKMSTVADKFSISASHFSTIFHQEFGVTFRDYLSNIRINHAKELLRTTNLSIAKIAYQCGYNDSHYFSSAFKRQTGLPPREFRAQS